MTRWLAWLLLLAAGQFSTLRLIDAGPRLHFQHYYSSLTWFSDTGLRIWGAFCLLQAIVVLGALAPRAPVLFRKLVQSFGWMPVLFALGISSVTSAALSANPVDIVIEFSLAASLQLIQLGNLVLLLLAFPADLARRCNAAVTDWLEASGDRIRPASGWNRKILLGAAWVTVFSALCSVFVYQKYPHIPDEVVYLRQASYMANGQLTLPAPPVPDAFYVDLMMLDGDRWYSPVPLGWPAFLMLGAAIGLPWLVNPLLAGLNVWLSWLLLRELYPPRTAHLTILLLCLSPWFLFMSMNFMTHTLQMTCAVLAGLALLRLRRTGRLIWGIIAGGAVGYEALVRPLDGLIVGLMIASAALWWTFRKTNQRIRVSALLTLGLATILTAAATLPYNARLTGNPLKFPIMAYTDAVYGPGSNSLGFGPNRGLGWAIDAYPGHTPFEALLNALLNGNSANTELLGWATGSLLAAAFLVGALLFRRGGSESHATRSGSEYRATDLAFTGIVGLVVGCYGLYYYHGGPEFGPRYWYIALLPLLVLSVRGLELLDRVTQGRATIAALLLSSLALAIYIPWRIVDKYPHFLGMEPGIRELAKQHRFDGGLVLIQGASHPDYASAAINNPLDLRPQSVGNAPIYVWDRSPEVRRQVLKVYPDRPVWIVEGPSVSGDGFRIVQTPNDAASTPDRSPDTSESAKPANQGN